MRTLIVILFHILLNKEILADVTVNPRKLSKSFNGLNVLQS